MGAVAGTTGFWIGVVVIALGGIAALFLADRAEGRSAEDVAPPMTAEVDDGPGPVDGAQTPRLGDDRAGRITTRAEHRRPRDPSGVPRFAPGRPPVAGDEPARFVRILDDEVGRIAQVLQERGALDRDQLAVAVGAATWGPGRFAEALRAAEREGQIERLSANRYAAPVPRYQA
jgi:hypothetical protein